MNPRTTPSTAGATGPLTPDRVVAAALALTARRGLFDWSVRDLARELGTTPSLLYHHVGGKDLLYRRVVEEALCDLRPPDGTSGWEPWFRELLLQLRQTLAGLPGTAKWLLLHGPTFPAMIPIIDAGLDLLRQAGFGRDAAFACSALVNTALQTLALSDERRSHEDDGPRDHAAMMREFQRAGQDSPAVAMFAESVAHGLDQPDSNRAEHYRSAYYTFLIDVTIAGLQQRLDAAEPAGP